MRRGSNRPYTVTDVSGLRTTMAGRLARLGFADAARAERLLLTDLGGIDADGADDDPGDDALLTALSAAADPLRLAVQKSLPPLHSPDGQAQVVQLLWRAVARSAKPFSSRWVDSMESLSAMLPSRI